MLVSTINYHYLDDWKKELIVDKEQGDVYAKFEKNGFCYLKKIDLTTGKIIESFKLEKHTFPTNIKIRNNTAYYLYKKTAVHLRFGDKNLYCCYVQFFGFDLVSMWFLATFI